jgi:hypothetical protein
MDECNQGRDGKQGRSQAEATMAEKIAAANRRIDATARDVARVLGHADTEPVPHCCWGAANMLWLGWISWPEVRAIIATACQLRPWGPLTMFRELMEQRALGDKRAHDRAIEARRRMLQPSRN